MFRLKLLPGSRGFGLGNFSRFDWGLDRPRPIRYNILGASNVGGTTYCGGTKMGRTGKLILAFLAGAFLGPKLLDALRPAEPKDPKEPKDQAK